MSSIGLSNTLELSVHGMIESRCEIQFPAGNKLDFSTQKSLILPLDIYCNQPMRVRLFSQHGGLKHLAQGSNTVNLYSLSASFNVANMQLDTTSTDLHEGQSVTSSGVIPFATSGQLSITLENNLLYAGHYKDVIEIEVTPSIHNATM